MDLSSPPDVLGSQTFQLGESPVWLDRSSELIWVDLEKGAVHSHSDAHGTHRLGDLGMAVGAVAPIRQGGSSSLPATVSPGQMHRSIAWNCSHPSIRRIRRS